MYSFRAITSLPRKSPKKRRIYKIPPEIMNMSFFLREPEKEEEIDPEKKENEELNKAIEQALSKDYKNRSSEFYDPNIDEYDQTEIEDLNNSMNASEIADKMQNNLQKKIDKIQEMQQSQNKHSISSDDSKITMSDAIAYGIGSPRRKQKQTQKSGEDGAQTEEKINVSLHLVRTTNNTKKNKVKENPFRREAHHFCTFPKRKPNPVTKEMKDKIRHQRWFEHKPDYYEESSDEEEEVWDPRVLNPVLPELTQDPAELSRKRIREIKKKLRRWDRLRAKMNKKIEENKNSSINIYNPPDPVDVHPSIKSPFEKTPDKRHLKESEDSGLLHPNSPKRERVRKVNNSLFESNIHFVDFEEEDNPEKKKRNESLATRLGIPHVRFSDIENPNNKPQQEKVEKNEIGDRKKFLYARRYPKSFLQRLAKNSPKKK